MRLLTSLAHDHGKVVLLSTHDVELAAQSADLLWIIDDTSLVKKNPQDFCPEEL
jgi:iron complex transport system ATP-binding protein